MDHAMCLGCMFFGTRVPEGRAVAILDRFVERGGRFLDTADNYAAWLADATGDESELLLGRWLAARGHRDRLMIATKVGARPAEGGAREGLSGAAVEAALEGSLRRLGLDHVDVLYAHIDDRDVEQAETMAALGAAIAAGRTRTIGASNIRAWRLALANELAARQGQPAFTCVQQRHTYLQPAPGSDFGVQVVADEELLDYLAAADMSLLPYSPLLSGAYTRDDVELPAEYRTADNMRRLAALRDVARDTGATPNQVVLCWLRQSAPVTVVPVIAASSVEQLDENLDAFDLMLDEEHLRRLNEAPLQR
jgi:aryl-alcohol dehydrogenase-like predicted oxidoreductase